MTRRSSSLILAIVLTISVGVNVTVAQQRGKLTVDTLLDWRSVADPQLSPDGTRIVYVYGFADKMNDRNLSNLWIASVDGKDLRPLTQGEQRDTSPQWSPDGKRLAYISTKSGKPQIVVRWMDTGAEATITDLQEAPSGVVWSPDGTQLAFSKLVPAAAPKGVKMPEKPKGAKWADPPIVVTRLWYRQDAQGYRPYGFRHVFVISATGGAARQITDGDYDYSPPQWMPDASTILTSAVRKPDAEWDHDGADIYSVSVAHGSLKQLTNRVGPDGGAVASPDGRRIAYLGFDEKRYSYTVSNLYMMNADGSEPKLLSGSLDRDVGNLQWAADSSGVYFTAQDHGASNLYFASASGAIQKLTEGVHMINAADVSRDGRVAAVISTPKDPGDLYTFTVKKEKTVEPASMQKLTGVNDSLLASIKLGNVEEIKYKSFDGREIQGWIVKPPDFDASKKYPFILYIHGGPHSMYNVAFNHEFQCHAANGYVLLYTNPRGSTGYGQDFGNVIQYNYPGDDYKDLMIGVDEMIKRGYVDDKKLAVTGGSGGGLLTAWIVGHTNRFAAAVSQFPVINWYSFYGTADGGHNMGWRWFRKYPWQDPEDFIRRSPITYADNVTTPTMIITGEEDFRTPMEQSEQFFRALKVRKVDSVLVRVPDEPHGASSNHISHRMAKVLFLMQWFDDHIKGKSTAAAEAARGN
jgi:dipeptidyl aminopeptidase/acylaminoacyl peptidase